MNNVKKTVLSVAFVLLFAVSLFAGVYALKANAEQSTGNGFAAGENSTLSGNVLTGGGTLNKAQAVYTGANFVEGEELSYEFASDKDFSVGYEVNELGQDGFPQDNARVFDHSYVRFTVLNSDNEGFEVTFFHQTPDYDITPNKIEINLVWLQNSITENVSEGKEAGRHYVETVYSFANNFGEAHTMSCYKYANAYRISADGTTFMAEPQYGNIDLSSVDVTIDFMAVGKTVKATLGSGKDFDRSHSGVWSTLGDSAITENDDGTTTFTIMDETEKMPVSSPIVQLREKIISTEGLDVRKPIVLQLSYSRYRGLTWFWGLGLSKQPYDGKYKLKFSDCGRGLDHGVWDTYRNNGFIADGKGLFIQPETGLIENTTVAGGADKAAYRTNNMADAGYTGLECIDTIRYEIGEVDTDIWYNGEKIFDDFAMKQSDFASSDYKAYPGFAFLELPSAENLKRSNVITVKGANAPYREDSSGVRYNGDENGCVVKIDCFGENPVLSFDAAGKEAVDSANYSYDDGKKELTLKASLFADFGKAPRNVFVTTKNGTARFRVRSAPDGEVIEAASVAEEELRFVLGKKRDFTFKIDCKGQTFSRVFGLGLFLRDVSFNEETGTVSVNSRPLNDLDAGEYVINIETIDVDGNYLVTTVPFYVDENPYKNVVPDAEKPSDGGKKGCKNSVAAASGIFAALAILAAAFMINKTKSGVNGK